MQYYTHICKLKLVLLEIYLLLALILVLFDIHVDIIVLNKYRGIALNIAICFQ